MTPGWERYGHLTAALVFAAAFIYQLFCAVKGFDMTDEGFLMSLYQVFGDDPSACPGASGYALSCWLGWLVQGLWPAGGLLWVRFIGVLIVTATMYLSYVVVRKVTDSSIALLGLVLQVLFLTTDPKPFGYNNLTGFFYIAATALIIRSQTEGKLLPLIFAGLISGLGVYLRLPNLAFAGLCILPFASAGTSKRAFRDCLVYLVCFAGGLAGGWMVMKAIGADSLILEFFSSLGGTLEGESTHSSTAMLTTYLINYLGAAGLLTVLLAAVLTIALLLGKRKWLRLLAALPLFVLYRCFYMESGALDNATAMLYNGIGIAGCCLAFRKGSRLNVIPAAAILFSLLAPLGSDRGFITMWAGPWLSLPIGLAAAGNCLIDRKPVYKGAVVLCLALLTTTGFLSSFKRPYYDGGSRLKKTSGIESPYAKGVRTKRENAEIINEVLKALKDSGVNENDTILVFDSSPMLYYLTHTHTFDGVCWPCLQYGQQYVRTLEKAVEEKPLPKAVVIQKFNNLGNAEAWLEPDESYTDISKDGVMSTAGMRKAVFDFITDSGFKLTWSNTHYDIYALLPAGVSVLPI